MITILSWYRNFVNPSQHRASVTSI